MIITEDIWLILNILAFKNLKIYFFTPPYCTIFLSLNQNLPMRYAKRTTQQLDQTIYITKC